VQRWPQAGCAGALLVTQHDPLIPQLLLAATALEVLGLHLLPHQGWTTPNPLDPLWYCQLPLVHPLVALLVLLLTALARLLVSVDELDGGEGLLIPEGLGEVAAGKGTLPSVDELILSRLPFWLKLLLH